MSHISSVKVEVKDLESLRRACARLGLEFVDNQTSYKWYGRWVGNVPVPEGFSKDEMGRCQHAIRVAGNERAYEVGVVQSRTGAGYELHFDPYHGGYGLMPLIGENAAKLRQMYATEVAKKQMRREGYQVSEKQGQDGKIRLVCKR